MSSKTLAWMVEYSVFALLVLVTWVWGSELDWDFADMDRLDVFPLLGLIAFVTMWWHFLVGFVRRLKPDYEKLEGLHLTSAYWVFAAFTLHPALFLSWGLQNGYGWSLYDLVDDYADDAKYPFVVLGLLSLIAFVLFDVARVLGRMAWAKRAWPFIDALSDIAFIGIWIHSLNLGQHLEEGWFRTFWLILGLSGICFIIYKRYRLSRDGKLGRPA